jgi:hypothetical protein
VYILFLFTAQLNCVQKALESVKQLYDTDMSEKNMQNASLRKEGESWF